jgi:Prokaryotic membrane lipoprotein lipid attachment site
MKRSTLLAVLAAALAGCSTQDISRNLYEGIRLHNESQRGTPREGPWAPTPTYDQYERERRADTGWRNS